MNNLPIELLLKIFFYIGEKNSDNLKLILSQNNFKNLEESLINYIKLKSLIKFNNSILIQISQSHKISMSLDKELNIEKIIKEFIVSNPKNFVQWINFNTQKY